MGGFGLSLLYEYIQVKTGLGFFDVDDLLLNTAGVLAGYLLFWVGRTLWGRKRAEDDKSS